MASGNTLATFVPFSFSPASSNSAVVGFRNGHPTLQFDASTQETAYFRSIMPAHYEGGGVTVKLHWAAASATSGTIGWDVSFEALKDGGTDIDSDSFATAQTVTAEAVDATSGKVDVSSVNIADGANMDSVAAGDGFRLRVRRDVASDTAAGDAQLLFVELIEQ